MAKEITDQSFKQEVLESKLPVLVDFWAPWCGPCKQIAPIIAEVATELAGKVEVYKCNIDENPETPSQYAIRSIPTLILFKDGKVVNTKVGGLPKSVLLEWIKTSI